MSRRYSYSPRNFIGVNVSRALLFKRRPSRFMKRQSPRIVFLYRPEIKPDPGTFRIVKPRYLGVPEALGEAAEMGAVGLPPLCGALGCQPRTNSSTKKPTM